MSDIGSIPAKDQTNYLLGRLEGTMGALKDTVVASAAAQAIANTQHEAEHVEFRKTLTEHASQLAVLKDNKQVSQGLVKNRPQWLMFYIGIPSAVAIILGGIGYLIANHP